MHDSKAFRVADVKTQERPPHMRGLPEETHIVSGTLVGNGTTVLASEQAKISAKVIQLAQNGSGGIDYQVAIYVHEPVAVAPEPTAAPQSPFDMAVEYLMVEKGLSQQDATAAVNKFSHTRILAVKEKELDAQMNELVNQNPAPEAPEEAMPPRMAKRLAQEQAKGKSKSAPPDDDVDD
jgi:glutaminase